MQLQRRATNMQPTERSSGAVMPAHPDLVSPLPTVRQPEPFVNADTAADFVGISRRTLLQNDDDYVFPSFRLKGKKPLSASIMVQKYLRPAAVKAGNVKEDQRVRFGFHNFRHSLASSLVKLKCDPKTVQGILRHEDVRTTMQLYAQSDQESRLEAQGKFLALLLGDKAHLLTETIQ
jgi:integrase